MIFGSDVWERGLVVRFGMVNVVVMIFGLE